ncbi:MAG: hypothetical protein GY855_05355 [candidate division Zixibacteria bacterium]|nr:hypothetical protein [candidate division Zixibacteria bacterium]
MDNQENNHSENNGYEKSDVSSLKLIIYGIAGIFSVVVLLIVLYQFYLSATNKIVEEMVLKPKSIALRELRAREIDELNSYKLLDEKKGVYRIPIEKAINIMADEAYKNRLNDANNR